MLTSKTRLAADVALSRDMFQSNDWLSIVLHRLMRAASDAAFACLLENLRKGTCTGADLALINSRRVASINDVAVINSIDNGGKIIVTTNAERDALNLAATKRWAAQHQQSLTFYSTSDVRVPPPKKKNDRSLPPPPSDVDAIVKPTALTQQDFQLVQRQTQQHSAKMLHRLPHAIGLPISITDNAAAGAGGVHIGLRYWRDNYAHDDSHLCSLLLCVKVSRTALRRASSASSTTRIRFASQHRQQHSSIGRHVLYSFASIQHSTNTPTPTNRSFKHSHQASLSSNLKPKPSASSNDLIITSTSNALASRSTSTSQSHQTKFAFFHSSNRCVAYRMTNANSLCLCCVVSGQNADRSGARSRCNE